MPKIYLLLSEIHLTILKGLKYTKVLFFGHLNEVHTKSVTGGRRLLKTVLQKDSLLERQIPLRKYHKDNFQIDDVVFLNDDGLIEQAYDKDDE